jgi:hypothetical protein
MAKDENALKTVGLLVDIAKLDTVYRDVYLRRARQRLGPMLDESAYQAIGSREKEIGNLTRSSRSAVLQRDWSKAAELAAQADALRQSSAAIGNLAAIGKEVYEETVVFEPFSPGKHLGLRAEAAQAELRAKAIDTLVSLAKADTAAAALYEKRRSYFAALELKGATAAQKAGERNRAQLEQLAIEAAEKGDAAALQRLAKELRDWKESGTAAKSTTGPAMLARYECPVDLSMPFPQEVVERARELGMVQARTAPVAELVPALEVIYAYVDQPLPSSPEMEREGALRARAQAELELPPELDTEESRVLAGQFIQQIFVNSGGARYLPPRVTETVLLEDFAENEAADAPSKLLAALRLPNRNGRSRVEIESALMRYGEEILESSLGIDPIEFRLVCIPYDLYTRFGQERGFGKWPHWTHFDGYQVMGGNRLRALAGGDSRFGGLVDLVSISPSDSRDGVYARFAVVRRARMTLRWR